MQGFTNYMLNTVIVLIVLLTGNFVYNQTAEAYIRHADISNFVELKQFVAEDICIGDKKQNIVFTRLVYGTENGYDATVVKELFLVERGMQTKITDEVKTPFLEISEDGIVTIIQNIPGDLDSGNYQWVLRLSIIIKGIVRDDVPLIQSNIFKIKECV